MNIHPHAAGVVFLLSAPFLFAQEVTPDKYTVTLHELQHMPPKEAQKLFREASATLKQGKFESGLKLLQKALALDPQYWSAENDLGYTYLKLGQIQKASDAFQQAIDIDPANVASYSNLGVSALILGDFKLAETSARRALQIDPTCVQAKGVLGLGEVGQGQWTDEAHRLLDEASSTIPAARKLIGNWEHSEKSKPELVVVESAAKYDAQPNL